MRMNGLLLATALVFTVLAARVWSISLDRDGAGQVLLYPFFTVENGWDTYINVSIPPFGGRILRMRILEPEHGELVKSFTLYGKSGENLRAAITRRSDEAIVLRTAEGGCIVADDGGFGASGTDFALDSATGMVEIYLESRVLNVSTRNLSCETLAARWEEGGVWRAPAGSTDGLSSVSDDDEISGRFSLINVERGLAAELPALGLRHFNDFIPHVAPESIVPSLLDAMPVATLVSGEEVVPESGEGIDAIALLLEDRSQWITNEVITEPGIGAATDWVLSFPLTAYRLYRPHRFFFGEQERACSAINVSQGPGGPMLEDRLDSSYWYSWGGGGTACDGCGVAIDPPPTVPRPASLCNAVNVLSFGDPPPVLAAENSPLLHAVPNAGSFAGPVVFPNSTARLRVQGPLIAFRATTFANGTLEGGSVLANYMQMTRHQTR